MRGDRPGLMAPLDDGIEFTPHARGSTEMLAVVEAYEKVYPACAGIDPNPKVVFTEMVSLPRMRGDRPS